MKGSLVFTAMRNEGPFILEWVAWYRMLGFEKILILHNDCTDHSPQLLRLLEKYGVLAQKRYRPDANEPPQKVAYKDARKHPYLKQCDWLFACDVDEFLVIHKGDGTVSALLDGMHKTCCGISVNWMIFGTSDQDQRDDQFVHRRFRYSAEEMTPQNTCVKSFVYKPLDYDMLRPHTPKNWTGTGKWGHGNRRFVLANGSEFENYHPNRQSDNGTLTNKITHADAQVNHYILQTREQYERKRGTPCVATLGERYNDDFFQRFNHNLRRNDSVDKYHDQFQRAYDELASLPGVQRLHHLCCVDFITAICEKRGDDPRKDPRFFRHLAEAKSATHHTRV